MPLVPDPKNCDISVKRAIQGLSKKLGYTATPVHIGLALTEGPFDLTGKTTVGSQTSPVDVTATREYGFELHYSGNNYDVTGIRSRAQLVTTDTTATALGGLFQAANNDGINAGVLMGFMAEAIGKSTANASTITTMRGGLIGTEWGALDTVTNLKTLHLRGHSLNAAGAGSFGTGYTLYIENEAVGGNGQAYDAGIYFKGTNLSAGNKAFTYGIDFSGGTFASEEIKLANGSVIGSDKVTLQPTTDSTSFFQVMDADGGTSILNVDSVNERVGIGTNTPSRNLHIVGVTNTYMELWSTGVNSLAGVRLRNDTQTWSFYNQGTSGDQFIFYDVTNNQSRIEISPAGAMHFRDNTGTRKLTVNNGRIGINEAGAETLIEATDTAPYLTLHNSTEEDVDGGGESRLIFKREDGAGTETAAGQIEVSHDGVVANNQLGKMQLSVNTGAALVQALEIDSDLLVTSSGVIRGATSLWWRIQHVDLSALPATGAVGAVYTPQSANNLNGYQLDNDPSEEYLYFNTHVGTDWDEASDLELVVQFETNVDNSTGDGTDTVDFDLLMYYKGATETTQKTQDLDASVVVGTAAQFYHSSVTFTIDHDLGGHVVQIGDCVSFRLHLNDDTPLTQVVNVIVHHAMFRYKTKKVRAEV